MNAHEITEAIFEPYKRNVEACTYARTQGEKFFNQYTEQTRAAIAQGEKFFNLYCDQTRAAYAEVCKVQDKAVELATKQQDEFKKYVEKTIEMTLATKQHDDFKKYVEKTIDLTMAAFKVPVAAAK